MEKLKKIFQTFLHGPIYIFVFGLIFFGIGAGLSFKQYVLARDGGEAVGEVLGFSQDCDEDGCSYTPSVRFTTSGGRTITFDSGFSSSPPAYDVGEQVAVLYSIDDPQDAEIKGSGRVLRIVFMAIGGVIMVGGLWFFGSMLSDELAKPPEEIG